MKQLEVQIMGQSYLLGCPERRRGAVCSRPWNRVDVAMCGIRDAGKIKARDRIAVLAALNLAFDLGRAARHYAEPRCRRPGRGRRPCATTPDARVPCCGA